jgi:hypothetical protein
MQQGQQQQQHYGGYGAPPSGHAQFAMPAFAPGAAAPVGCGGGGVRRGTGARGPCGNPRRC